MNGDRSWKGAALVALTLLTGACRRAPQADPRFPVVAGPVASTELTAAITAQDRRLFDLVFVKEDAAALRNLLAADFHFHHDKGGLIADSPEAFVTLIHEQFQGRASGQNVEARREPVSEEVFPLAQHGAIHQGVHRFYGLHPDGTRTLRETGRFFHVWRRSEGGWKLAEVYSYDHRPAG